MEGREDFRMFGGVQAVRALIVAGLLSASGCASFQNKITSTPRSGSEQLLLTGTSDCAVGSVDFRPLAGSRVYLDTSGIPSLDAGWVIFSLRREMARQGLLLVGDEKEAQVIVEAALGAYAIDEADHGLSLPSAIPLGILSISTGNTPSGFSRKNRQDAVVKLGLIALDAGTGALLWESGTILRTGYLDRRFLGSRNVTKRTSVPELERYPPLRW